ncbi:MAG: 2-amino-4-hydroxy-6-hydroxymethyldihydropteridine diphosphokinase [Alphaproteobacteria bacterium]|nr:2-amino-4-hydroxy-6-hydroxymethyldihydropteridine diphosphokinase [Alphaproteobacteria bacterium]
MIIIGLGANLPSRFGGPDETLAAAKEKIENFDIRIVKSSRVWVTAPVPASDQPLYRNAVLVVETPLAPEALIEVLQGIERDFGRVHAERNAARLLDLDVLAYNDFIMEDEALTLPHPRMHERGFVLRPLHEIAPGWVHPVLGVGLEALIARLPAED